MLMNVAHKSWRQIFELVFDIPFLAALVLHWIGTLSFPRVFFGR